MADLNFEKPIMMSSEDFKLLPDVTVISKEIIDEIQEDLTEQEEEFRKLKEKAMICKVIAFSNMGFNPLTTNGSLLHRKKKKELLERVKVLFEKTLEELNKEFNEIVCDELSSKELDYNDISVYKRSYKSREKEWNESLENLNISV